MKLATLCYVTHNGQTLMLHRVKKDQDIHHGKWNGLGGKFMAGETPEQCVIREVKEESGLTIAAPQLRGFLTFPRFDGHDDWYVFLFVAETQTAEFTDSAEGRLAWIETDRLLELNLWEGDRIFLPWVAAGRFFSAKFEYVKGTLKDHSVVFYGDPTPLPGFAFPAAASSDQN